MPLDPTTSPWPSVHARLAHLCGGSSLCSRISALAFLMVGMLRGPQIGFRGPVEKLLNKWRLWVEAVDSLLDSHFVLFGGNWRECFGMEAGSAFRFEHAPGRSAYPCGAFETLRFVRRSSCSGGALPSSAFIVASIDAAVVVPIWQRMCTVRAVRFCVAPGIFFLTHMFISDLILH